MKYKTQEHVVAFIDILGAKNKINNDVNESLNVVHSAYNEAIKFLNTLYRGDIELLRPQIRIFSDNIVVAVPTSTKGEISALMSILVYSGLIQHQFLHHKYLVRGGISIGDFFIDDIMLWGTALTKAYEIESTIAIYPRIVLDPFLVGRLNVFHNNTLKRWLSQDVDKLLFIDYMQKRVMKDNENFLPLAILRLEEAEQLLNDADGHLKVQQKILWHLSYIRKCIEKADEGKS